jgi:hypothetical protein
MPVRGDAGLEVGFFFTPMYGTLQPWILILRRGRIAA